MQEERKELHKKILVNLALAVVVVLAVVFLLPRLLRFFLPFVIAWILALLANPVIHFLEKRIKIMRKHGTALIIILVLAAICLLFYGCVLFCANQVSSLVQELPQALNSVEENLEKSFAMLHAKYSFIPSDLVGKFENSNHNMSDYFLKAFDSLIDSVRAGSISRVGSWASSLMNFIVYVVLTTLAAYFMTVEKEKISSEFRKHTPEGVRSFFQKVKQICKKALGSYFVAHFKIMVVIFFLTVIPFGFMGVSYNALLAAAIAVVDFLPFFGAGTILCPWALYEIATGSYRYAVILIVIYLVIVVLRQLLEPKFIGDSIGVSSFEILIFMMIGYRLSGMLGLILGIPVGMILKTCYQEGMFQSYIEGVKILAEDINEYRKY